MPLETMPEPPSPPDVPRRVRLYRYQWIGVGLLLIMPVLAMTGFFDETWRATEAAGAEFQLAVRYPDRFRYKQLKSMQVRVRNTSTARLDTVTIALDTALANGFSTVRAVPAFSRAYEAELTGIEPGESRLLILELQGETYGGHRGWIRASRADTVGLLVSITVFP
jgi:hypothetical protein